MPKFVKKFNPFIEIPAKSMEIIFTFFFVLSLLFPQSMPAADPQVYPRETPIVHAVRKVSPAVVNISSEFEVSRQLSPFSGFGMDPFFDSFFKDFFDPGFERRSKRRSLGSGVIIDGRRGFILTNAHVVEKTGIIQVVLNDQQEFDAQVIGSDPDSDLAVLKIQAEKELPAIAMGDSENLMIGETVIAIGNPFGFSHTVTTGVISAVKRSFRADDREFQDFIQTDASINPGNSGGPLLNINGELIGINTAIYAKAQGIGFAIPIHKAKRIVTDLIRYGEVVPAWIGLTVQEIDARLAKYLKAPESGGVLVKSVEPESPAQKAGIRDGDLLISIASRRIRTAEEFDAALKNLGTGKEADVTLWRDGKERTLTVVTSIFPQEKAMELAGELLGITVEGLTAKNRTRYRIGENEGVMISGVRNGSYLDRVGVVPGDIIRKLDDTATNDLEAFKKAIIKSRKKSSVVLLLQRESQLYYITVKL
ncbi:MAG: Do family serine endopeptidase [Desulfobacteraceae bacterium]|nr:MAG: Do family serine endopeptidase [Desulfobacteraceae bacterium]